MVVVTRSRSRFPVAPLPEPPLQKDLVAYIAELLLPDDLTHFVRLRAVCKPWRQFTAELKTRADVLLPRDWILLSASNSQFDFFNTASGKSFSISTPLLHHGYSLSSTVNCFLLLKKTTNTDTKTTDAPPSMALLNLFTGFLTELPPIVVSKWGEPNVSFPITFSGGFTTSKGTLIFFADYLNRTRLIWKHHQCDTWFYYDVDISCFNYFCYNDSLYGMEYYKGLVRIKLDFIDKVAAKPGVELLAPYPRMPSNEFVESACVFNCAGTIVLVLFSNDDSGDYISYEKYGVFKLNTKTMRFVCAKNINDHAIFISREKSLSVSYTEFVGIHANSIVFCGLTGDVVRYDVPRNRDKLYSPHLNTIAGQLVNYCWDEYNMQIG